MNVEDWKPASSMWGRPPVSDYIRFMKYQKQLAIWSAEWCASALEMGDTETAEWQADEFTRYEWNYYAVLDFDCHRKTNL